MYLDSVDDDDDDGDGDDDVVNPFACSILDNHLGVSEGGSRHATGPGTRQRCRVSWHFWAIEILVV